MTANAAKKRSAVQVRCRRAFTLVEMLVVIGIIAVLVATLFPAINAARAASRRTACMNNLRQFGQGLIAYSDKHDAYCSGAFDWLRDGAVTEVGWVADLVDQGIRPGQMLCPGSPAQMSSTYQDLLAADTTTFDACVNRAGSAPRALPNGGTTVNPCRQIIAGALAPNSEARRDLVEKQILARGYNTNYTPSWFLVRCGAKLSLNGDAYATPSVCSSSLTDRAATYGPINQARIEASRVGVSNIPALGCGGISDRALTAPLGAMPAGTPMCQPMTRGPRIFNPGFAKFVNPQVLDAPSFAANTAKTGADGWWIGWSEYTLQDYRFFGPVHRSTCNILFLDGSVRNYVDQNGDGLLNNGFPSGAGTPSFAGGDIELPPGEVLSRWSLSDR